MNSQDNTDEEFQVLKDNTGLIQVDPLLRPDSPVMIEEEDVPKHYQIIAYQRRPTAWDKWKHWFQQVGYDVYFRLRWWYIYGFQ